jgi:outer membrane protein OmpA-like peptidoglycan-associated protein
MILNLTTQNAELQKQIDELNRRYADAVGKVGTGMALPEALSNELSAFAAQNPDLVSFDPQRGIVKFKSDVTFATGKDELQPKAKEAIQRFSQILNSSAAAGYELMVAGTRTARRSRTRRRSRPVTRTTGTSRPTARSRSARSCSAPA